MVLNEADRSTIVGHLDAILARAGIVREHLDVAAARSGVACTPWTAEQLATIEEAARSLQAASRAAPTDGT